MNQQDSFRDRLVSSQQFAPEYRERYRREMESMFSRSLTPVQRAVTSVFVLMGLAAVAILVYVALNCATPGERYGSAVLGFIVLAISAIRLMMAVTGTVNLRWQSKAIAYVAFYGCLVFGIGTLFAGQATNNVYVVAVGLFPLMIASIKLILTHIYHTELNTREKLLEIELKLAEISESVAQKGYDATV